MNITANTIRQYSQYVLNLKSLVGILLILYALYNGSSAIPASWQKFTANQQKNDQLTQNKNNLVSQRAQLSGISKDLDHFSTQTVMVKPGDSPDLVVISVAQKLVNLSDSLQNKYVKLDAGKAVSLDIDKAVTLPINVGGLGVDIGGGSQASGTTAIPGAPSGGASPTPAPPPGGGGSDAAAPTGPQIQGFEYQLVVKGSFLNLLNFIHEICKSQNLVLIKSVALEPADADDPNNNAFNSKPEDIDALKLTLNFIIPWH